MRGRPGSGSIATRCDAALGYAANSGSGGSNYTGCRIGRGGKLAALIGSTSSLPGGSQPGEVLFNDTGSKLAGVRVGTSLIDSLTVRSQIFGDAALVFHIQQ